jgi:putative CocE/NonD family hydrolase
MRGQWGALGLAAAAACSSAVETEKDAAPRFAFGECRDQSPIEFESVTVRSLYVPMRDSVRIALDVVLPENLPEGRKIPAILTMTRYWRSEEGDGPSELEKYFARRGYAVVTGDSRGTGASFGTWPYHRAPDEVRDFGEVIDWIVSQPWSNGAVGGFGTSYTANTADWMAQLNHPALKAIVPRFPDFDPYADLYFPGGIFHVAFGRDWGQAVKAMDLNVKRGNPPQGVKPVDEDEGGVLLQQAIEARRDVPGVFEGLSRITFRDDRPDVWNASMLDWSIHTRIAEVERSGVPIFSWGGWLDAGTAAGVLHRFTTLSNPQKAILGPWSHGGGHHASPFRLPDVETVPSREAQLRESLCYFDRYLKGIDNQTPERELIYYTLGEEAWKSTATWPPPGSSSRPLYLAAGNVLSPEAPTEESGEDTYTVDFEATTGTSNRWYTNNTGDDVVYDDRSAADARLLTYTSEPLEEDLEVTGTAVARIHVRSTTEDSAFFVYLENVDPSGRVIYVTEGQLRALHRKVSSEPPPYTLFGPYHSFLSKDALPMKPGETAEIAIAMHPTSALFKKGHRIRLAIGGADKDTFARIPPDETPQWTIERNRTRASSLELPVIERH